VFGRIEPWIEIVERKLAELGAGSAFQALVSPRDAAFGIVALYLGIDMLTHLQEDRTAAESLLDLGIRYAPLAATLLPSRSSRARR
jgi:hypothetical protein